MKSKKTKTCKTKAATAAKVKKAGSRRKAVSRLAVAGCAKSRKPVRAKSRRLPRPPNATDVTTALLKDGLRMSQRSARHHLHEALGPRKDVVRSYRRAAAMRKARLELAAAEKRGGW